MQIKEIPINKIESNPWNPNNMRKEVFERLTKDIKRIGYTPIIVRKLKEKYQIIDGENRFRALKSLKFKSIDAIVVQLSDNDAKIATINLNKIRGSNDPKKLYAVVDDLLKALSNDELKGIIGGGFLIQAEYLKEKILQDENEYKPIKTIFYIYCPNCKTKHQVASLIPKFTREKNGNSGN